MDKCKSFKLRLLGEYIQEWRACIKANDVLLKIQYIKTLIFFLIVLRNRRIALTKLGILAPSFRVHIDGLARERVCYNNTQDIV